MAEHTEAQLQRQIEAIKEQPAALGDLRPGSLSTQYNVCGSPNCRCKAHPPVKHGPYYQISFTRKGGSRTNLVRTEELPEIRRQPTNYQQMKSWSIAGSTWLRDDRICASPGRTPEGGRTLTLSRLPRD